MPIHLSRQGFCIVEKFQATSPLLTNQYLPDVDEYKSFNALIKMGGNGEDDAFAKVEIKTKNKYIKKSAIMITQLTKTQKSNNAERPTLLFYCRNKRRKAF